MKGLTERQKELFAEAAKQGDQLDQGSFRQQVQALTHDYELLLRNQANPAPTSFSDTLQPGETKRYDNAVLTMFGANAWGANGEARVRFDIRPNHRVTGGIEHPRDQVPRAGPELVLGDEHAPDRCLQARLVGARSCWSTTPAAKAWA